VEGVFEDCAAVVSLMFGGEKEACTISAGDWTLAAGQNPSRRQRQLRR
jgi:hypothetical protein